MDSGSIAVLTMGWQDKIPQDSMPLLQDQLKEVSEDKMALLGSIQLKNPIIGLLFGIFLGGFGADRFYKGDFLLGGIKLGLFILYFISLVSCGLTVISFPTLSICLGILGFIIVVALFIWGVIDLFLVWKGIKRSNLAKIQETIYTL